MRLDQVLAKIDVTVVRVQKGTDELTIFLRASPEKQQLSRWKRTIEELLMAEKTTGEKEGWRVDLSQMYYVTNDKVRYLWRLIIRGDRKAGAEAFGLAATRSLSTGSEVMSFPLIGRASYEFDPANGKMKGAHSAKDAAMARKSGLT